MDILCLFGMHKWTGCKCEICGKTRKVKQDKNKLQKKDAINKQLQPQHSEATKLDGERIINPKSVEPEDSIQINNITEKKHSIQSQISQQPTTNLQEDVNTWEIGSVPIKNSSMKIGWYCFWRAFLVLVPIGFILWVALHFITGALLLLILVKNPDLIAPLIDYSEEFAFLLSNLSYWSVIEQMQGGIFDRLSDFNMLFAYFFMGTIVFNRFGKRTIKRFFTVGLENYSCIGLFSLLIVIVVFVYLVVGLPFGYLIDLLNIDVWILIPWLIFIAFFSIYATGYIIQKIAFKTNKKSIMAKWSLGLAIINIPILGYVSSPNMLAVPVAIMAIILGINAIINIKASSGIVRGKGIAFVGIIIAVLTGITPLLMPPIARLRYEAPFIVLEDSMQKLGAMKYSLSPNNHIYYSNGATESEARKVSVVLTEFKLLPTINRRDFLLSKESNSFIVSLVLIPDNLYDTDIKKSIPQIEAALEDIMGVPIQFRIVDFHLKELGSYIYGKT